MKLSAGLLALCLLVAGHPAAAQETVNFASISGRVTDPSGAVVAGAHVTALQVETNQTAAADTDGAGRFRFAYLRVGAYDITVSSAGFADATRRLTLTVGAAFDLPVSLAVAGVDTSVDVSARALVLEGARSQIAGTISQVEVRNLPMSGRNFLDLALLVPGVSPTNVGSTQLFAETSAVPGQGLSISSQRNFSNNFIVDGLSANDDAAGLSGIPYGVDAVEQFQVVTSGGQAELGRALGGYINVVTKSGTNIFRGDLYDYVRDARLNAPNALSGKVLPMSQSQHGGSLGGPIVRDRAFFFSNVEQRRLKQSGLVVVDPAIIETINARLAAVGYPGAPLTTGEYPNPVNSTTVLGKVDHQISGQDQFSLRYSLYDVHSSNARGTGGTSTPSASAGLDNTDQSVAVGNTLTLSPRTVNETRVQYSYGDLRATPSDSVGPAVSIAGIVSFGTLSGAPTGRLNEMFQAVDNLSHQAGAHALRIGADFLYNRSTITFPRSIRGAYSFSSLSNFLAGVYNNAGFNQTFGATVVSQANPNVGAYVQDEWKIRPRVTLNAGVRYDLQSLETINTDANNFSPRVGMAWSPFDSQRTVVRGSAGLYFDRVPLRAVANALLSAGNTTDLSRLRQTSVSLSPGQAGAPAFPQILGGAVASTTLFNLTTMNPDMQNAYSRQAGVEIEQQWGLGSTVSVGYQYTRGLNLIIQVNQNVPTCVAAGTNNGCRPISAYANNSQYSPMADSAYHGWHVTFVQRPARWGSYRVSYAYSRSMNNVGEAFFSSPIDPFDLSKDWGRSDDDQRHRLVVAGSVNSPMEPSQSTWERVSHGFQVSSMLQAYSALPFNITSGVTTVQGTAGRPIVNGAFIDRNAGEGSDFFSLSLRISRTFAIGRSLRLEGQLEAFNVTNRVNNLTRQANFGTGAYPTNPSPNFNTITAVGDPRTLQLGIRLRF